VEENMIFISYNEKDKEYAALLKAILEKNKKEVLNISDKIKPGDNIIDKITESINLCNIFIFLISKSVENSKWVDIELTLALNKSINNEKVIILPIIINGANIPFYLEKYLCLKINGKEDLIKKENIITCESQDFRQLCREMRQYAGIQ
jgi:hypothetical protein